MKLQSSRLFVSLVRIWRCIAVAQKLFSTGTGSSRRAEQKDNGWLAAGIKHSAVVYSSRERSLRRMSRPTYTTQHEMEE